MRSEQSVRAAVYGALAGALALVVVAPSPLASLRTLRDAGAADVVSEPLVALVSLLAWCLAAYLLAVAALTAGAHLPGRAGRTLAGAARRTVPAGLRRALEVALGVSLVVGTLGTGTATAAGPLPLPGLSAQSGVPSAHPAPVIAPTPSLDHPVTAPAPSLDHPLAALTPSLDHPVVAPASTSSVPAAAPPTAPSASPSAEQVVVQPGDSLWSIAQERLEEQTGRPPSDAQVAQAWPSWWQANRDAVGDDPHHLHPGTPLVRPSDS